MPNRPIEADDIHAIYDLTAHIAVDRVNESPDELMPLMIAVHIGEKPGKIKNMMIVDPVLINMMQRNGHTKDMLMSVVRGLLSTKSDAPDAVVHMSETWMVARSERDANDPFDGHDSLADHPARTEAVMVNVHTRIGSYVGLSPITTEGGRRRATFTALNLSEVRFGRMILDPEGSKATH